MSDESEPRIESGEGGVKIECPACKRVLFEDLGRVIHIERHRCKRCRESVVVVVVEADKTPVRTESTLPQKAPI